MKSVCKCLLYFLLVIGIAVMSTTVMAAELGEPIINAHNVVKYGALGDGSTLDTTAIQDAIDECNQTGGGIVYFPAGMYVSDKLFLKDNVGIYLDLGATLLVDENVRKEGEGVGFINGQDNENIVIMGSGKIRAAGVNRGGAAPIKLVDCKNVLIKDITIEDAEHYCIHILGDCVNVKFDNVTMVGGLSDGINAQAKQMSISNCNIDTYDDNICLWSGENVAISNCQLTTSCNALAFRGAMGRSPDRIYRNIVISNISIYNSSFGIDFEIERNTLVEGVLFSNIIMYNTSNPINVFKKEDTILRDITFSKISIFNTEDYLSQGAKFVGQDSSPIENVTFDTVKITGGMSFSNIRGLSLSNVQVTSFDRSAITGNNVQDLNISDLRVDEHSEDQVILNLNNVQGAFVHNCQAPQNATFINIQGSETSNINIIASDLSKANPPIVADQDIETNAIAPEAIVEYDKLEAPDSVEAGEPFVVTVGLRNLGMSGVVRVNLVIDEQIYDSQWIWLEAGHAQDVTFEDIELYQAKEHEISVGTVEASVEVEQATLF